MPQPSPSNTSSSATELAIAMAKLWPHREHESNAVKSLLCRAGIHRWRQLRNKLTIEGDGLCRAGIYRWRQLDLRELVPGRQVYHCFWCSKVRIDGVIYEV